MSDDVVIEREEPPAKWRWRCPEGHTGWQFTGEHLWCTSCKRNRSDPVHHTIIDRKMDEEIPTGDVVVKRTVELPSGRTITRTRPRNAECER
jgi:hypothetical protein